MDEDATKSEALKRLASEARNEATRVQGESRVFLIIFIGSLIVGLLSYAAFPWLIDENSASRRVIESRISVLQSEEEALSSKISGIIEDEKARLQNSWVKADINTLFNIYTASFSKSVPRRAVIAGEQGYLAVSDDCGESWKELDSGVNVNLLDSLSIPGNVYGFALIVGYEGVVLKYNEDSNSIERLSIEDSRGVRDIYRFGRSIYISGERGLVKRSEGIGAAWEDVSIETDRTIYDLQFNDAGLGIAVGEKGLIARSLDFGQNWEIIDALPTATLQDVLIVSPANILITGRGGVSLRYNSEDNEVSLLHLSTHRIIDIDAVEGSLIVSGDNGFLAISDDAGATFEVFDVGAVNLRQISSIGQKLIVPTNFGDVVEFDLMKRVPSLIRTEARANLSSFVAQGRSSCSFIYGYDGEVVYPSSRYADLLAEAVNGLDDVRSFYNRLPERLRDATQALSLYSAVADVENLHIEIMLLEDDLKKLDAGATIATPFLGVKLPKAYVSSVPVLVLFLLMVDFVRRKQYALERRGRNLQDRAFAMDLIAASGNDDLIIPILSKSAEGGSAESPSGISHIVGLLKS